MIGILDSVSIQPLTSSLSAAATTGDTVLEVDSVLDFDETGLLSLGGTQMPYTAVDEDTDTIIVAAPIGADFAENTQVQALEVTGAIQQRWLALVQLDPEEGAPAIPIHTSLIPYFREGISQRGIRVEVDLDAWVVTGLPDMQPTSAQEVLFRNTDSATATGPGDLPILLTYEPIDGSEHVYWNGVLQEPTEWTRDDRTLTLLDPDDMLEVEDVVVVAYAYWPAVAEARVIDEDFEAAVRADNPVLWARFDESSGGTAADSSGNGHDGAYGGSAITYGHAALAPGLPGTCVDTGGDGWAEFSPGAAWQRDVPFSVELWYEATNWTSAPYVVCCDDAGTLDADRVWNIQNATVGRIYNFGAGSESATGTTPTTGVGHQVLMTVDALRVVRLYQDGVLAGTSAPLAAAVNPSTLWPLVFGASANGELGRVLKFNGKMQHGIIYDTALSDTRVAAHFAAGMAA